MKCSICEQCAHIQCIAFTREDRLNARHWICAICTHNLFPFQDLDADSLNDMIMSDSQHSVEINPDLYANKILNPFDLNDLDISEPNFDIDPDMYCFSDVGYDLISKCDYFTEESFSQYCDKNISDSNHFSFFHHNIRSLSAHEIELNVLLECMSH